MRTRRHIVDRFCLTLACISLAAGCSIKSLPTGPGPDSAISGGDVGNGDAAVAVDVQMDVHQTDLSVLTPDAAPVTGPDALPDAAVDVSLASTPDAPPDIGVGGSGGSGGSGGGTGAGGSGGAPSAGSDASAGTGGTAGTTTVDASGAQERPGDLGIGGTGGSGSGGSSSGGGSIGSGGSGSGSGGSSGGAGSGDSNAGVDAGGTNIDYSGHWVGLTNQGLLFEFTVFAGAATQVTFDWEVQAPGPGSTTCVASGETSTTFGTPVAITSGSLNKGPISGNPLVYTVSGTFSSATQASGSITLTHTPTNCTATTTVSWTAEKVVCGDGRIEWPETCDDGNTTPSDGCSEICQLTPVAEIEPDNTIATAGPPITGDAIRSGSISPASDLDVYAIQNPYPGTVAIVLETHGETIGTCHIDTLIQIVDSSGNLLAQDDDGSRALYCSLLQYSLSAGQTIYVVVSSADGSVIPTYNLHVQFQKS